MPWQETSPMEQRMQFIVDHQRGLYPMAELCARYRIADELAALLLPVGLAHPRWGSAKLVQYLAPQHSAWRRGPRSPSTPSISVITDRRAPNDPEGSLAPEK